MKICPNTSPLQWPKVSFFTANALISSPTADDRPWFMVILGFVPAILLRQALWGPAMSLTTRPQQFGVTESSMSKAPVDVLIWNKRRPWWVMPRSGPVQIYRSHTAPCDTKKKQKTKKTHTHKSAYKWLRHWGCWEKHQPTSPLY